jgi:Zn finger protein HypA/HybF involved in hydrogenase expression
MSGEVKVTGWPEEHYEGGKALDEAVIIVDAAGVSIQGMNGAITNNRDVFGKTKEQLINEAKQLMAHQPIDVQKLLNEGWDTQNMSDEAFEEPQVPIDDTTASMKGAMLAVAGKIAGKCSACGHVGEDMKNGYCSSCHQKREEQKGLGGFQTGDFSGKEADATSQRKEEHKIVLTGETTEDIQWALANAEQEGWTPEYIEAMKEELARRGHNAAAKTAKLPLKEGAEEATCKDCGGKYDPSKGSCGCHDNNSQ